MSQRSRALAACCAAFAALAFGAAARAEESAQPQTAEESAQPQTAEGSELPQTLDLTSLTYVDSNRTQSGVILQAEEARVLPERKQVLMGKVGLRLATADSKGELHLRCDHGELDLESGSFVGIGDVRGRTPDGRRFETARLHYDHAAGLVTTDAPVVIRDAGGTLRGGGFRYLVREGRLKLLGGATVEQSE